ncbi:hypothetical protein BN1708_015591 [Verticillium longisporum]|uniref:Uncharacterized protein n=1 Tax=Verticillium longisporum TaxID=100787 RepID=A0A0G4M556_VERLO|nr:hypothetical protein BN1708_015591 [Verticillium longisporum]
MFRRSVLLEGVGRLNRASGRWLVRGLLEELGGRRCRALIHVGALKLLQQHGECLLLRIRGAGTHDGVAAHDGQAWGRCRRLRLVAGARVLVRRAEEGSKARGFATASPTGLGRGLFLFAGRVQASSGSESHEELVGARLDGRRRNSRLLGLDRGLQRSRSDGLVGGSGSGSGGGLLAFHALHELLKVLLRVTFMLVGSGLGILVLVPPALGAIDALTVRLATAQAVSGARFERIIDFGVLAVVVERTARPVPCSIVIVPLAGLAIGREAVATSHATMEALGAFGAETLARLDGAPALGILIAFPAAAKVAVPRVAEPVAEFRVAIATVAKVEAIAGVGLFGVLVGVKGSGASGGAAVAKAAGRGKGGSRRSEYNVFRRA